MKMSVRDWFQVITKKNRLNLSDKKNDAIGKKESQREKKNRIKIVQNYRIEHWTE